MPPLGRRIAMGRQRPPSNPYLIIQLQNWTWKVLKAYNNRPDDQYSRWFCYVTSPATEPGADIGDVYIADIVYVMGRSAQITYRDPEVPDEALPAVLRNR